MTINTAVITTGVANDTDAHFRLWVQEVIDLLTANSAGSPPGVSLTPVTCTGEINTSTVTAPTTGAPVAGFKVFAFNDALSSTYPIFFKLWFGCTQYNVATPAMWIQVCSGAAATCDSSGNFSGGNIYPTNAQLTAPGGSIPVGYAIYTYYSAAASAGVFTSRVCYNPTYGFVGFNWKVGFQSANNAQASFFIFRSNDATGAATSDAVNVLIPSNIAGWTGSSAGYMTCLSNTTNTVYPLNSGGTAAQASMNWSLFPLNVWSTLNGTSVQIAPAFTMTPTLQVSNYIGLALLSEIAVNATITGVNLVGTLGLTYVQCGFPFGGTVVGCSINNSGDPRSPTLMMLWQ
jgi:hypothetical protein